MVAGSVLLGLGAVIAIGGGIYIAVGDDSRTAAAQVSLGAGSVLVTMHL